MRGRSWGGGCRRPGPGGGGRTRHRPPEGAIPFGLWPGLHSRKPLPPFGAPEGRPGLRPPSGGDMRELIVSSLVSLDGVYGDPQSWASDYFDDQAAEESLAVLLDSDAMLMGRRTYEYFAPAWSAPSGPYLERINEIRKYVFSSTLTAAAW